MRNTLPTYTGLKDFARGVQKLYKLHGNIPVFIGVAGEDEVSPFESLASPAYINPQYMAQGCLRFLGVTETPIRDGEPTKDLQQSEMGILRKEAQQDGSIINSGGDCFVVAHGKYLCFWRWEGI